MKKFIQILSASLLTFASLSAEATLTINVAPSGSDLNDGSTTAPVESLEGARKIIEKRIKADGGKLKTPVEVVFATGEYKFRRGVLFNHTMAFSKNTPLTIRAKGDGKVFFTGGVSFPAKKLKLVTDKKILDRLPPEKPEGKLYMLNLKDEGITDYGTMRQHGFGSANAVTPMEVFYNGEPLYLAQYPNVGEKIIEIGKIIDDGAIIGKNGKPRGHHPGSFTYEHPRVDRWAGLKNIWLHGKFSYGYCEDNILVKNIDTQKKVIELANKHIYKLAGGQKYVSKKREYWEVAGLEVRGYTAYNLLEEADKHGEYFIDRDTGIFYVVMKDEEKKAFLFPKKVSPQGTFEFSILEDPFITISKNSFVTIKGIDFKNSRGMGVRISNSQDVTIDDCQFYNLGTVAVSTFGNFNVSLPKHLKCSDDIKQNARIKILNSKIFNTGQGGIYLVGGNRKLLTHSNNLIENCELYNTARYSKTYAPAVNLRGCGGTVINCDFHDIPHMAILYNGNDFRIRRNSFARMCRDYDDMGPIYTGRNPTERGTIIDENFFTDIYPHHKNSNMCGVYMDDGSGGIKVARNIFCKVGNSRNGNFGAVYVHGGHDNIVEGNFFVDCRFWIGQVAWTDKRWADYVKSEFIPKIKAVDADSEIYAKRYPDFKYIYGERIPRNNIARHNRLFRSYGPTNGRYTLRGNSLIEKEDVPYYESWTLELVRKHFADHPLVKSILAQPIGLKKPEIKK